MKKHLSTVNSFNKAATIIALSTILGTITYAWTGPTGTAPSNNTPAPINVGSTLQEKLGSLNVREAFTITGGYKGYSALTTAGDDQSTLVTKSYVDGKSVTETDPTVPAYVKDGTDWTEVTNKPTDYATTDYVDSKFQKVCTVAASITNAANTWEDSFNVPQGWTVTDCYNYGYNRMTGNRGAPGFTWRYAVRCVNTHDISATWSSWFSNGGSIISAPSPNCGW